MKKRVIAALAAVGLVAAMSGFGTLSAAADEVDDPSTVVVDETTPDETTPPAEDTVPPAEETDPPAEETDPPAEETDPPAEETDPPAEETDPPAEETDPPAEETDPPAEETDPPAEPKVDEPAEAAVPVVEGYTEDQVKQALALMAEYGVAPDPNARTASFVHWDITICHADKWGWEELDVDLLGYFLHWIFDWEYDILPPLLGGLLPGNNWDAYFGGLTGQQIYDNGCSKKVWVYHAPEAGYDEHCWDGAAQPGSIWVKYTWNLEGKGAWVITGPNGYYYEVPFEHGWVEVWVPAGEYSVEFVSSGGWYIKHGGPFWIDIYPAINCECTVNMLNEVDATTKVVGEEIVIPYTPCAEAEVEVTPPTCEAASTLILGETYLAEWGDPEYTGSHYKVTAYADDGYRFYPGEGVPPDGLVKVFEGDLAPKLTNCGGLPVTGSADPATPLWLAGLAMIAGIGALVVSTRRGEKVTAE